MAISYGSRGAEVKALQQKLNAYGAGLAVDGVWGPKTQAAYTKYKTKLSSPAAASTNKTKTAAAQLTTAEKNKPTYTQSTAVKQANQQLAAFEAQKPGEYQSQYGDQIQAMLDQILNRPKFNYDFNADPMYQQYKDRFTQQGRMAMMDTMGQAAALTGGYGSTYGQTAGQQVFQGYLQQANDIIPQLQQGAYQRYADEGAQMQGQLGILQGLDESDYGRHQDTVNRYFTELNYLKNKTSEMSDRDYQYYLNNLQAWQADRDYWLGKTQYEQDQQNWQTQWDHKLALEAEAKAAAAAKSGGGGGSGGRSYGGSSGGSKSSTPVKKTSDPYSDLNKRYEQEQQAKKWLGWVLGK